MSMRRLIEAPAPPATLPASFPEALAHALRAPARLTVAASGGIDSLCLSAAAALARDGRGLALRHALSPAVPAAATARLRGFAAARGLTLEILDAGEFADPRYRANPLNRCYFCKSNLYDALLALREPGEAIAAGTNTDDLGDFRPGLAAASERSVLHPFVAAGMDKAAVRALARALGLGDLAELPASPCLASRIETGLRVEPEDLRLIDAVEEALRHALGPVAIRCRRMKAGLFIEIEAGLLEALPEARRVEIVGIARRIAAAHGAAEAPRLRPYRQGAAFVGDKKPRAAE